MYLKLSSRKRGEAIEIAPEDVATQTQGLEDYIPPPTNSKIDVFHIHMQLAKEMFEADDKKKPPSAGPVMIERSWRVSPEEFIVKIDASPLHQSAARRMFDKNKPTATGAAEEQPPLAPTAEETEQPEPSEAHRSEWGEFWDNMTNLLFTGGNNQK
jgi:hypothetical protein